MRNARWLAVTSGLLLSGAATWAAGCGRDADDCSLDLTCANYAGPNSIDPRCQSDPMTLHGGVPGTCGIFVSPTAPTAGDGSQKAPFQSLQAGLDQAQTTHQSVYVCAGKIAEAVVVHPGTRLYGGLDCDHGWTWNEAPRTTLEPSANPMTAEGGSEIALKLEGGSGDTVIEDLDVIAPDAVAAGASSIAMLAGGVRARLLRGSFTAGNGKDGASGESGAAMDLDGIAGEDGVDVCQSAATSPGAMGMTKDCGSGVSSAGGKGGDGIPVNGATPTPTSRGGDGTPDDAQGQGGLGQDTMACTAGSTGADGAPGDIGAGADSTSLGAISANGFMGVAGQDGKDGKPGQGGGGGGGAKGDTAIACNGLTMERVGASGGSGGTGGCGGQHGSGGKPGGASIALVSLGATLTLESVTLTAQDGGKGGNGGDGQAGGVGGKRGLGGSGTGAVKSACDGGIGGGGGYGGPGGGGQGGHSLGIAYTGVAPKGAKITVSTKIASGGSGGMGAAVPGGKGTDGLTVATRAFN